MNALARMDFTDDDRQQFAQLIGYRLSGYGELPYVSKADFRDAAHMIEGMDERDSRIAELEQQVKEIRVVVEKARELFNAT